MNGKRRALLGEERRGIDLYRRVAAWELEHGNPRVAAHLDVLADWREHNLPFVGFAWYDPRGWNIDPAAKYLRQRIDWYTVGKAMRDAGVRDRAGTTAQ